MRSCAKRLTSEEIENLPMGPCAKVRFCAGLTSSTCHEIALDLILTRAPVVCSVLSACLALWLGEDLSLQCCFQVLALIGRAEACRYRHACNHDLECGASRFVHQTVGSEEFEYLRTHDSSLEGTSPNRRLVIDCSRCLSGWSPCRRNIRMSAYARRDGETAVRRMANAHSCRVSYPLSEIGVAQTEYDARLALQSGNQFDDFPTESWRFCQCSRRPITSISGMRRSPCASEVFEVRSAQSS